jgi:hypothetical protein
MANVLIPHIKEPQEESNPSIFENIFLSIKRSLLGINNEYDPQHAALAIRTIYSQALETLFALLLAAVQAPLCPHAWILKYRTSELRSLVENIDNRNQILWKLKEETYSWDVVSNYIHMSLILEQDKDKEEIVKKGFSKFWSRLASEFIKNDFTKEYNSIKHGLRIRSGGFFLAIGKENEPGKTAPPENMRMVGKGEYGSTFNVSKRIDKLHHHFQIKKTSRNWSPTDIAWSLHLISMSILNIINALKILNGDEATKVKFHWPSDLNVFAEPWKRSRKLGITSMSDFGVNIHPDLIEKYDREEIISRYKAGKDAGVIKKEFNDED